MADEMDRMEVDFVTPSKNNFCLKITENKSNFGSDSNENKKNRPSLPPRSKPSFLVLAPPTNPRDSMKFQETIKYEIDHGRCKLDPNLDRKKLGRMDGAHVSVLLARRHTLNLNLQSQSHDNRLPEAISGRGLLGSWYDVGLSSSGSRVKKDQYVFEMEKMVKNLQETITILTPQIESYKEKRKILLLEHDSLKDELEQLTLKSKLHEMELKEKTLELDKLKELEKAGNKFMYETKYDRGLSFIQFIQQSYPNLKYYEGGLQTVDAHDEVPNVSSSSKADEEEINDIDQYLNFGPMNFTHGFTV